MAQKKKAKQAKSKTNIKKTNSSSSSHSNAKKYVYDFGKKTDGDAKQKELLGGKGANLAEDDKAIDAEIARLKERIAVLERRKQRRV